MSYKDGDGFYIYFWTLEYEEKFEIEFCLLFIFVIASRAGRYEKSSGRLLFSWVSAYACT